MNIALITAGGRGTRTGFDVPKQFICVNGKPILLYTLEAFQYHPGIDAILVVCLEGWSVILTAYAKQYKITKLRGIVDGGESNQESIFLGLKKLEKTCASDDTVFIHDGNRPLVSQTVINNCFSTFQKYGSAIAAIPCVEAVFRTNDGISSDTNIPRDSLYRTQTPHVYRLGELLDAYREAESRDIHLSVAVCTLMNALGKPIYFAPGSERNLKITTTEDIELFEALL
jgi:2-C-methyl-D-erythritol 4-phosphate cytidylyltransferase